MKTSSLRLTGRHALCCGLLFLASLSSVSSEIPVAQEKNIPFVSVTTVDELPILLDGYRNWRQVHDPLSSGELDVAPTRARAKPLKIQGLLVAEESSEETLEDSSEQEQTETIGSANSLQSLGRQYYLAERSLSTPQDLSTYVALRLRLRGCAGRSDGSSPGQVHVLIGDDVQPSLRWRATIDICRIQHPLSHPLQPYSELSPQTASTAPPVIVEYLPFDLLQPADATGRLLTPEELELRSGTRSTRPLQLRRISTIGFLFEDLPGKFAIQIHSGVAVRSIPPPPTFSSASADTSSSPSIISQPESSNASSLADSLWHLVPQQIGTAACIYTVIAAGIIALTLWIVGRSSWRQHQGYIPA